MATAIAGLNRERRAPAHRRREYLLLLGTLTATFTYAVVLTPPGRLWHDRGGTRQHEVFSYCNAIAVVASFGIVFLLFRGNREIRSSGLGVATAMALNLLGLTGAYAAWRCWSFTVFIFVIALAVAVLCYIAIQLPVSLCKPVETFLSGVQETPQKHPKLLRSTKKALPGLQRDGGDAYESLKKSRMSLLLLSILAASVTYQAGLKPPRGFWPKKDTVGRPPFLCGDGTRIVPPIFFYGNATTFVVSLAILLAVLLRNVLSTRLGIKYYCALQVAITLELFSLTVAYAAGSSWQSPYVSMPVVLVVIYIGIHGAAFMLQLPEACSTWRRALREKMEHNEEENDHDEEEVDEVALEAKLEKRRKLLLILAILSACLAYHDSTSPNDLIRYRTGYLVFLYCNAAVFIASLCTIVMLANTKLPVGGIRWYALRGCVTLGFVGHMGILFDADHHSRTSMADVLAVAMAILLCVAFQVTECISGRTARGLMSSLKWAQMLAGADGEEEELEIDLAGGPNDEPLRLEISSPIYGGALTIMLAVPVVAMVANPVKLLVAVMIASMCVSLWRKSSAPLVGALQLRLPPTASSTTPRE